MKRKILVFLALFMLVCTLPHAEARKARTGTKSTVKTCSGCTVYGGFYFPSTPKQELSETAQIIRARKMVGAPTDMEMRKPWLRWVD